MEDDNAADVTSPDASADPGSESTSDPSDLQSIADAFDAQALEEAGADPSTEAGHDGGEGVAPPATTDPLDLFIHQNYKGDRNAFLTSQFESRAEAKRLAEEVKELRSRISPSPTRDTEADIKARLEQDARVQAINRSITSTDRKIENIKTSQLKLAEEAATLNNEIAKLEGQLAHADEIERPKILHELTRRQSKFEGVGTRWDSNNERLADLDERRSDKLDALEHAQAAVRDSVANEERAVKENRRFQQRTRESFVDAFSTHAKQYGLEPKTKAFNFMRESIRTQVRDYLDSVDDDITEIIDPPGMHTAVGKLMAAAADAGLVRRSNGKQPEPLRPTPRPVITPRRPITTPTDAARPASAPRSARTTADLMSDPDYIRRRADGIVSAAQRAAGRKSLA